MIKPHKKLITGIVLTLFMTAILSVLMIGYNLGSDLGIFRIASNDKTAVNKYQGVVQAVRELNERFIEAYDSFYSLVQVKADMAAKACYKVASEEGDACIRKHSKGSVIKIENGKMTIPEGTRVGLLKYSDRITGERGTMIYDTHTVDGVRKDILVYSHIKGPYYYVEIINGKKVYEHVSEYIEVVSTLNGLEYVYGMTAVLECPHHENSRFFFCYPGDMIYNGIAVADGGDPQFPYVSWNLDTSEDAGLITDEDAKIHIGYVTVEEIEELDCKLTLASPETNTIARIMESSVVGNVVIIILCIVFIVYITSIYKAVFCGTITKEKKNKYTPARIRINAAAYGIIGILAVFVACIFIRSLSNLYMETGNIKKSLEMLGWRLMEERADKMREDDDRKTLNIEYGQRLAELLEKYPHMNDKENLKILSSTVGARYIMLFDAYGREVSTSSDYIGLELGAAGSQSTTEDFRRILKGVPYIAHSAVRDEVTGRMLELVGVRTNDLTNGGYGVLILAMKPEDREHTVEEEVNAAIKSLSSVGRLYFSLDSKTKTVVYTGFNEYDDYYDAEDFGLSDSMIRDNVSDFIRIDGKKYYCISDADAYSGLIHYGCIQTDQLFGKGIGYAVTCAIGFGLVFGFLCLYLFNGYTDKAIEEAEQRGPEPIKKTSTSGGFLSRVMSVITHKLGNMTPEEKALMTLRVFLSITIVNIVLDYYRRSGNGQREFVLDYILSGAWNRGINLFAFTAMLILFCGMVLLMFFVRLVLGAIGTMMSPKGRTICKLIANMIGYLSILLYLYYALSYLGVDTRAILASVGIIGLGLTTGARDLISDILSGISLIFEGEYQMGDIVSIDGYRGMVQEVGVRTTKLEGRGGNIKTIRNSDVKNVINLTKLNSWVPVTIKVDVNYPLRDAEEIIAEALPRIRERYQEIISGPYYKGVLSVELGFAVLSIIAECHEDDFHRVERILIREVLMALRDKNVPVR